jgi:hypothetical protein
VDENIVWEPESLHIAEGRSRHRNAVEGRRRLTTDSEYECATLAQQYIGGAQLRPGGELKCRYNPE